jgi:DNA modification methylase
VDYRIICGDAFKEIEHIEEKSVDIIFTSPDPPREHSQIAVLVQFFNDCYRVLKDKGALFVQMGDVRWANGDWMMIPEVFAIKMVKEDWMVRSKVIWERPEVNGWEYLYDFVTSHDAYFNKEEASKYSIIQTLPYKIPPPGSFESGFPEKLIELAIDIACPAKGTVLDPFCDSAVTGVVASRKGRKFIGIELDPKKISKINKRLRSI